MTHIGTERMLWLDAVKGWGILLVIISHLCVLPHWMIDGYIPLFFIAAGITYKRKSSYWLEFKSRAKRLLFPYMFYNFIYLIILLSYYLIKHNNIDLGLSILGILYSKITINYPMTNESVCLLGANAPMWFLTCMFVTLQLCAFIINKHQILILPIILCLFAIQECSFFFPWSFDFALFATLFVFIGNVFKEYFKTPPRTNIYARLIIFCICLVLYLYLTELNGRVNASIRNYGILGSLSIPIFFIISCLYFFLVQRIVVFLKRNLLVKFLAYMGKHSLRLLCIHLFIAGWSHSILTKMGFSSVLGIVGGFLIVLFVDACIEQIVNKRNDILIYI